MTTQTIPGDQRMPLERETPAALAVDEEKAGAFAERVFNDLSAATLVMMCSLGDRLGLFKHLQGTGPATSEELATRAGVSERYAREWLSALFCAGYLTYDPPTQRFALPPEHAPVLAEEDGPLFLGGLLQDLPPVFGVFNEVAEAFRTGGGVPMSAYDPSLWEGMERESAPAFEHQLLQVFLPAMPEVQARLERGAQVADIGCGSGRALIKLATAYPNARFVGYDAFEPQVNRARANARAAGLEDRVRFEVRDAEEGLPESYDVITSFDVVHDARDPLALLRAIRKGLRAEGIYVAREPNAADRLEENAGPMGTFFYSASVFYCMTTSLAQNGAGLGTMGLPESKLRALAEEAGFSGVRRVPVEDPFEALYELRA